MALSLSPVSWTTDAEILLPSGRSVSTPYFCPCKVAAGPEVMLCWVVNVWVSEIFFLAPKVTVCAPIAPFCSSVDALTLTSDFSSTCVEMPAVARAPVRLSLLPKIV